MRAGSNQTVVVLFPGALGDIVLVLPTLRRVRTLHPEARLVVAVDRRFVGLVVASGVADHVAIVDGPEIARTLGGGPPPDWWGRAPRLYSWLASRDHDGRRALAEHGDTATFLRVVRDDGPLHAALEYAGGIGWHPSWDRLVAGGTIQARRCDRVGGVRVGAGALVVHRGAGAAVKCWPHDAFGRVASWWCRRTGPVFDLRGPADQDLPALSGATVITPSVSELPGLLAAATAFVGNDSGPAHVAGAVGASGVVVFGPTRSARWRPVSASLVALQADASPGRGFGRLDADVVIDVLDGIVTRARAPSRS